MGNNKAIRQRMETYRSVLLVLNWIIAIGIVIFGFTMVSNRYIPGIGIGIIIAGIVIGIIGHFGVNVRLAIPFILLNNGDILESMKGGNSISGIVNLTGRTIIGNKIQKKCARCKKEVDGDYTACPHCGNNKFE